MMKIILILLFITSAFAQNNQLTNFNRASQIDSLLLKIRDSVTFNATRSGFVPPSGGGTSNYLRADGSWATPPGTGGSPNWGSIGGTITNQTDLISYINANTNPDATGWRLSSNYGAVGDGVTNDYNALRDCFASGGYSGTRPESIYVKLEAGKTFYVGGKGFHWDYLSQSSPMGVRYLHIDGQGSTIWTDTTATENGYVLSFTAYYNTLTLNWTAIPNNYTRGDLRIRLPYSVWNGAQKGDIIWITTHPDLGGTHTEPDWVRYSVSKGELAEIHTVHSDTTVSFTIPLDESYTTATTVVKRFFFPTIVIENLSIKAKSKHCSGSNKRAIDFNGIKNSVFRNITVEGFEYLGIMVNNSINLLFDNIFVRDLSECANYGMNYGIVLGGTQDALITNSNILAGRHAVDLASSYYLPSRRLMVTNSFLAADLRLGTSSVATHPGVKDFIVTGNVIHGILASRSTHNIFSNNYVLNHFNDGQGSGQAAISIGNAWNPNGGYNIISNNYIEGRYGGIQLATGNVNGMLGNYYITNNVVRNQYLLKIDTYYEGDNAVQNVNDIIVHDNDFQPSKTGIWNGSAVVFGYDNVDTLVVNNFSFQSNNIRNSQIALLICSPSSRTDIGKLTVKNNNFYSNGIVEVQSGSRIGLLDISGNTIQYAGSDAVGGWVRPVWLRSGATITTFKHTNNTYYNFGSMGGEAFVQGQSGVVTNFYRGGDIFPGATSFTSYSVSATNGFRIDWTTD